MQRISVHPIRLAPDVDTSAAPARPIIGERQCRTRAKFGKFPLLRQPTPPQAMSLPKTEGLDSDRTLDLTLVVTASPIPSHPSPAVLREVVQSIATHAPALLICPLVLVFDGCRVADRPMSKLGKVSGSQRIAYEEFVDRTSNVLKAWGTVCPDGSPDDKWIADWDPHFELPFLRTSNISPAVPAGLPNSQIQITTYAGTGPGKKCTVTLVRVLGDRLGQALAVKEALQHVSTKYVFACQHDWRFGTDIDVRKLLEVMDNHSDMNYLGFVSRRTKGYGDKTLSSGFPSATLDASNFGGNHIARTFYYKNVVFCGRYRFKRGDFIEDTFGHRLHAEIRAEGLKAWGKYGLYLYYPNKGTSNDLVHVNGRMYLTAEDRKELERVGRLGQLTAKKRNKETNQ
ncbi:hypothetical protein HDU84_002564 [Entophlyctis sp. JEL0112]|nr:hypothetical protein HDU84_002564 [Entophlyctis sp. JEL0112]